MMQVLTRNMPITCMTILLVWLIIGIVPINHIQAAPTHKFIPEKAVTDLYTRISSRDLEGVLRYLPEKGFTEIGVGAAEIHKLDKQVIEAFLKRDLLIDLRPKNMMVQKFGNTIIVTGTRVGSITPKGESVKEKHHLFSMVWIKSGSRWLLRHVHLSGIDSSSSVIHPVTSTYSE